MATKLHPLLKYLRKHGHSYRDAAEHLDCSFVTVGNICRGEQTPKRQLADRIVAWTWRKVKLEDLYQ